MGQVEGEAQGEDDVLQSFMKDINQGPRHAHVVKVEKSEIEVQDGETGFEVRHWLSENMGFLLSFPCVILSRAGPIWKSFLSLPW